MQLPGRSVPHMEFSSVAADSEREAQCAQQKGSFDMHEHHI